MKITKSIVISLVLLLLTSVLYRVFPDRPYGFAPQFAMAIFAGALFIKDKGWAFVLPLLSMLLSDALYQYLYNAGVGTTPGFYNGQFTNYLLVASLVPVGFMIKKINLANILVASVASPTLFFLLSNFFVWVNGGGLYRPKTLSGLMMCYTDGLPFYGTGIVATILFSGVLFGGHYLLTKKVQTATV